MKETARPVELETANDVIKTELSTHMQVKSIDENIYQYVLEDAPDVLTVGFRGNEKGYGFLWEPYAVNLYITTPHSKRVQLVADGYCPYLRRTL
jgi:hypothetical protein